MNLYKTITLFESQQETSFCSIFEGKALFLMIASLTSNFDFVPWPWVWIWIWICTSQNPDFRHKRDGVGGARNYWHPKVPSSSMSHYYWSFLKVSSRSNLTSMIYRQNNISLWLLIWQIQNNTHSIKVLIVTITKYNSQFSQLLPISFQYKFWKWHISIITQGNTATCELMIHILV